MIGTGQDNTHVVTYSTTARGSKRFDGKDFSFFHLCLVVVLDEWDRLSTMNVILLDVVCAKATNWFHWVCFPTHLDLVAFHGLLDGSADVADADVDSCSLQYS